MLHRVSFYPSTRAKTRVVQTFPRDRKKETQKIFSKINATKLSIEIQIDKFTEEQESLQKTNAPLPSQSITTYLIIDLFDNKIRLEFSKTLQIFTEVKINGSDFTELTNKSYLLIDRENLIPGLI